MSFVCLLRRTRKRDRRDEACPSSAQSQRRRLHGERAERVVELEEAIGRGRLRLIVGRVDRKAPVAFRLYRARRVLAFPREPIDARRTLPLIDRDGRTPGPDERRLYVARANDFVRQRLFLGDTVAVRRQDRRGDRRRVDTGVRDQERLGDGALAGGVGGPVEQLSVECDSRRAAASLRAPSRVALRSLVSRTMVSARCARSRVRSMAARKASAPKY